MGRFHDVQEIVAFLMDDKWHNAVIGAVKKEVKTGMDRMGVMLLEEISRSLL